MNSRCMQNNLSFIFMNFELFDYYLYFNFHAFLYSMIDALGKWNSRKNFVIVLAFLVKSMFFTSIKYNASFFFFILVLLERWNTTFPNILCLIKYFLAPIMISFSLTKTGPFISHQFEPSISISIKLNLWFFFHKN